MRPIEKHTPVDSQGEPKIYSSYQKARRDLIMQLGDYCCYCGMQLDGDLAVEHVQPKNSNADLALKWDNFLLACRNCNSTKGSEPIALPKYYWPDLDNTYKVFIYGEGGTVALHPDLSAEQSTIAERTLKLTRFDKKSDEDDPTQKDRRWSARMNAWDKACRAKVALGDCDSPNIRQLIIDSATSKGFWVVWATVFENDSDMLQRLRIAFSGTYQAFQNSEIRPRI